MVTEIFEPALTWVTCLAARAFSVFSPMSMLPVSSVRPHSLTTLLAISWSRMMVVSCWHGLMDVQLRAMSELTISEDLLSVTMIPRPVHFFFLVLNFGSQTYPGSQPSWASPSRPGQRREHREPGQGPQGRQ